MSAAVVSMTLLGAACEKPASEKAAPEKAAAESAKPSKEADVAAKTRLVTVGGTVTEIVFALGAGEQVVAADKSSVYPPQAAEVATLDLFRKVSAEGILSTKPTLVLATAAAKPDQAFELIKKAGVEVVRVDDASTIEATRARIKAIGGALGLPEKAAELIAQLDGELKKAKAVVQACEKPAKTLFLYARGPGMTFVAGRDTAAAAMIELAGGVHVPTEIEGFKPMTAEAVIGANPDVLLMTGSGLKSSGGIEGLRQVKGLGQTPAVLAGRVVTMGDLELLGFGPRTGTVAIKLAESLCLDGKSELKSAKSESAH